MDGQKSEVARLLQQIDLEYQSAYRGLGGFASGTARHDFVNKRMKNIELVHERLIELVGPDEAIALVVHTIDLPKDQHRRRM
jgi:hypothetical protein